MIMTALIIMVTILQTMAIALGVGSSTLAIVNFFVAIADGKIDETERRMMGVVYVILRVAMVAILVTSVLLAAYEWSRSQVGLSAFSISQLLTLLVLFLNGLLMTAHLVPSTIGPAIQAGSWYTLGVLVALQILGLTGFSICQFLLLYLAWIVLAIVIVNGVMAVLKAKREGSKP